MKFVARDEYVDWATQWCNLLTKMQLQIASSQARNMSLTDINAEIAAERTKR